MNKNSPIIYVSTALGVVLGGAVWLIIYAKHVGSIEFDGPAMMGLELGLIVGALTGGVVGAIYDIRHKKGLVDTIISFVMVAGVLSIVVGSVLSSYARNKWDYAGTHQSECQVEENNRPLACQ